MVSQVLYLLSPSACALMTDGKFSSETLVTGHETTMSYNFEGLVILDRQISSTSGYTRQTGRQYVWLY